MTRRGVYLLPSTVTTLSLGSGFFALLHIFDGNFKIAGMLVILCVILDGLDGRIARLTQTESRFGAEYDSLSDGVVFGCVPAFLTMEWLSATPIKTLGFVYIVSFLYLATTLLRLARFNVHVRKDRKLFLGLPSPAAATFIASLTIVFESADYYIYFEIWAMIAALLICSVCMVSNFGYYSFKQIDFSQRIRLIALVAGIVILAIAMKDIAVTILLVTLVYILSAPALYVRRRLFHKNKPDFP